MTHPSIPPVPEPRRPHFHGYLWIGDKTLFAQSHRRPSERGTIYTIRLTSPEFYRSDVPPVEVSDWLIKSPELIDGTFDEPCDAAEWMGQNIIDHAYLLLPEQDSESQELRRRLDYAALSLDERVDVSVRWTILGRRYLSVSVVACSPNRVLPCLRCPFDAHRQTHA